MEGLISPPIVQNNSNTSNNGLFNPFLISMLGIVVTITAILIYHFILLEYCMRRHAATTTTTTTAAAQKTTGVDEKILQNMPILTFCAVKRRRFHTDQEECVVCLGELEDEDMVRFLPNCSHAFHVACIDRWFTAHASCPLCRSPVAGEPPNTPPRRSTNNSDHLKNSNGTSTSSGESQSPPTVQSSGQYRHCVTLALPAARSLSMDQSFVALNLQISYNCSSNTSSRGELTSSDRASSKLLNSFSLLRLGKGIDPPILPY